MDERNAKRDLVLAPSEYAYMQDVTKGIIKTYTGPTVINPTAQERPVAFNSANKQFEPCTLELAVQQIAIAPEGYYLMLKNPSTKDDHPVAGGVQPSPDLDVGRKITITGPCAFALWPGQMVKLVQGHHLRSNQYLLVRVYNEDEAKKHWSKAVIKPASDATTDVAPASRVPPDLTVGKLLLIKGTDVSFYIPPTGVGVVPDEHGPYVREALTLERLEYCILVDQNGKKRYERGPQVVFPEPTEAFIASDSGERKFRAVELNEIQGLHIKVIAPYSEGGHAHKEGDELFITGKETAIYYPREEHSLVRYDGREKHFAVAVPAGEGRYVMNRKSGEINLQRGPAMLLPNPIDEVMVRRVLTDRECATWYPGNAEVLAYNRALRAIDDSGRAGAVVENEVQKKQARVAVAQQIAMGPPPADAKFPDALDRSNSYTKPRTVVFNTRYEGVPSLTTWVGYAVLVVDKAGNRRVEQGPKNLLFKYDETLEIVQLSTGTPKTTDKLIDTVFLRVLNNKVSDRCIVETSDHVAVTLKYSMRVNFEGEPLRWFEVENYVKFLCDHVRSVLKGSAKKTTIETFYASAVEIIRDSILGKADDKAIRVGMKFPENGMRITDVEVLEVQIDDADIAELLSAAQHEAVEANVAILRARRELDMTQKQEAISRDVADARAATAKRLAEIEVDATADRLRVALAAVKAELDGAEAAKAATIAKNAVTDADHASELARRRTTAELDASIQGAHQALVTAALQAEVEAAVKRFGAAQGGFSEALLALSNHEVLAKVAEAMSVQAFVGGKTLTDVIDKVFAGTPLAGLMDRVKTRVTNGTPAEPLALK